MDLKFFIILPLWYHVPVHTGSKQCIFVVQFSFTGTSTLQFFVIPVSQHLQVYICTYAPIADENLETFL